MSVPYCLDEIVVLISSLVENHQSMGLVVQKYLQWVYRMFFVAIYENVELTMTMA